MDGPAPANEEEEAEGYEHDGRKSQHDERLIRRSAELALRCSPGRRPDGRADTWDIGAGAKDFDLVLPRRPAVCGRLHHWPKKQSAILKL